MAFLYANSNYVFLLFKIINYQLWQLPISPTPSFFVSKNLQITYKEPASQNESRIALGQAFLSVRLVQQYTRTATSIPSATGFELESRGL